MESTAACLSPRSGVTAPIADPSFGLKRRNVRDKDAYTLLSILDQIFACFIFWKKQKILVVINAF